MSHESIIESARRHRQWQAGPLSHWDWPDFVECPACGKLADVSRRTETVEGHAANDFAPITRVAALTIVCRACAYFETIPTSAISSHIGYARFRNRLKPWLRERTRFGWLEFPSVRTLLEFEHYVAADLRERRKATGPHAGWSMNYFARLPLWTKSAKNRDELLHAIARLKARATKAGVTIPPGATNKPKHQGGKGGEDRRLSGRREPGCVSA